ncbi:hypothetical protein GQ55_7G097100 [Panicum hallii var. hallii]|nr:hypothetical protein GQ55_7G097100 [Panicum hallii var. hallii]
MQACRLIRPATPPATPPPPPRPGTVPRRHRAVFIRACNAHPLCQCDWRGQPPVGAVGEDGQSHRCVLPGDSMRAPAGVKISSPTSSFAYPSPLPSSSRPGYKPYLLLLFPHRKPLRADLCRGGHGFGDLGRGIPIAVGFLGLSSSISG